MPCKHRCPNCTQVIPSESNVQVVNGVQCYTTVPGCHPNVDSHALVTGSPPKHEPLAPVHNETAKCE
jgi:hypothetical protein